MLIQRCGMGAHVMTHGVQEQHWCRPIRAVVIAIDADFDARIVHKTPRSTAAAAGGFAAEHLAGRIWER